MQTTLPNNIPPKRLEEINFIVENIKKELWNKEIEIEKIILFWSYAKGTFVEKDVTHTQNYPEIFRSDFDIMVITKKDLWEEAGGMWVYIEDKISKKKHIETPFTILLEDLNHVNTMLSMGRYFYSDVKKEWVLLFDASWVELAERKILTKEERLEMMKEDFELWFPQWEVFFENFKSNLAKADKWDIYLKNAAFQLHQAAESYMTAYLLVKTMYKEKTHDLRHLYIDMMRNDEVFRDWFNLKDEKEFFLFELLRDAYVRARYDKHYKIIKEELEFLQKKVIILRDRVERLCKEEIKTCITL